MERVMGCRLKWSRVEMRCRAVKDERVVVVGGGIGGLATAAGLHKCAIPVTVLERSDSLRVEGTSLGLMANAWRALDALSIGDDLRSINPRCTRAVFFDSQGDQLNTFRLESSKPDTEMRGVLRRRLLETLAEELPEDCIQYGKRVIAMDCIQPNRPILKLEDGTDLRCRVVIGADGERSSIAASLGLPPPIFSGNAGIRGVSEFDVLPIPPQTIYYFLGNGTRSGMYQAEDNKIYWFIAYNAPQDTKIENAEDLVEKTRSLAEEFGDPVVSCVKNCQPERLSFAKLSDRIDLPFFSIGRGTITLVGDAFHPTTPNLGQGAAMALEDAVVLARSLASIGGVEGGRWGNREADEKLREKEIDAIDAGDDPIASGWKNSERS